MCLLVNLEPNNFPMFSSQRVKGVKGWLLKGIFEGGAATTKTAEVSRGIQFEKRLSILLT